MKSPGATTVAKSGGSEHIPQILPAKKASENPPPYRESAARGDTASVI